MENLLRNPVAVAASGLVLVLLTILYRAFTNPLRSLPGPWYSTFTRLPLKAAIMSGRRVFHVHDLHQKYGPVVRISPDEVAVSDHEGLAQIHRIGGAFRKTEWYHDLTAQGDGRYSIFTMTDPKEHAARRRLLARPFSKTFLNQHWHGTVRELTRMAVRRMGEAAKENGGKVDVMQWWTFMTMDVAGRLMFGHSFDNLQRGTVSDFMRVVTSRLIVTGISVELPWIKAIGGALTWLPIPALRNMLSPNDALYEHGRKFLHSIQASETSSNIFSNIAAEAEKGEKLSMDDVHLEASGLIVAGTDTTSATLTYLTWAVLSRPTLQHDLEQEASQLPEDYTDTDVEKLPLLNAVIEESLRLYGAAPAGLPRAVPPGGTSIAGHFINAGTTVTTQAYTYHRDASLFPDPDEFLPSRWLHDGISAEAKKAFHPFGAGARTCAGLHLAYMELRLASAEFFRQCRGARLAESATEQAMEMENYFLVVPRGHKCEVLLRA